MVEELSIYGSQFTIRANSEKQIANGTNRRTDGQPREFLDFFFGLERRLTKSHKLCLERLPV
ncbi:MAG: hypothetical protein NTZ35_03220, partial [Ignavibacteriales bacterium]|nr:hypothetical protein [Ignavibacteriales bacterium]